MVNRSHTCFHMPYYHTLRKPYSSFIEYLQILSGGQYKNLTAVLLNICKYYQGIKLMMFSIKLQTLIHFCNKKQEQITRRLNHNFKTGKTLRRSVPKGLYFKKGIYIHLYIYINKYMYILKQEL